MSDTQNKRITILTAGEIEELYSTPKFNQIEREEYFSLDKDMLLAIRRLNKVQNALYLILLIGLFRAKPVISNIKFKDVQDDLTYVCKTYFPGRKGKIPKKDLNTNTQYNLSQKMLTMVGYSRFDKKQHLATLRKRLDDIATIRAEAKYVFDECIAYFGQERIGLPGYTTLQDIVTDTLRAERLRLEGIMERKMTARTQNKLLEILNTKGMLNNLSAQNCAKSFSPSDVDKDIQTHETIRPIYPELKKIINTLKLSQGNLAYYASIVKHQPLAKIKRYSTSQSLLYIADQVILE